MSTNPPSPPPPDEEEIAHQAALAALNESVPLNNTLFGNSSLTMQLQSEVFELRHNFIDEADAIEFYEQAQRNPGMKLTDCMQKQAIELLNFRILVDPEFNIIDRWQRHDWFTILSITQVATLVVKYFCPNGLGECTLAETFSRIPFHYQIANHDHENATFIRYNELVSNYDRSKGPLTEIQHAELIQILEKRLAKGSQIRQDYLKAKAADTSPPNTWTWYKTMLRIGQVLAEARSMMNIIKSYSNPDVMYSFPTSAIPDVGKKESRHSLPHHLQRLDHSLRQCVPLVRTFRLSMDSPSVRRRKCRSYNVRVEGAPVG